MRWRIGLFPPIASLDTITSQVRLHGSLLELGRPQHQSTGVHLSPANHAILTVLKAGETVCQTLFVPKLEFQTLKALCQTLFVSKTASETLFLRPSMHLGCGARYFTGARCERRFHVTFDWGASPASLPAEVGVQSHSALSD